MKMTDFQMKRNKKKILYKPADRVAENLEMITKKGER